MLIELCDLHQLFAVITEHKRSFFSVLVSSCLSFLSVALSLFHTHTHSHTQNLSSSDPLCTAADVIYPQLGCGVFG